MNTQNKSIEERGIVKEKLLPLIKVAHGNGNYTLVFDEITSLVQQAKEEEREKNKELLEIYANFMQKVNDGVPVDKAYEDYLASLSKTP